MDFDCLGHTSNKLFEFIVHKKIMFESMSLLLAIHIGCGFEQVRWSKIQH